MRKLVPKLVQLSRTRTLLTITRYFPYFTKCGWWNAGESYLYKPQILLNRRKIFFFIFYALPNSKLNTCKYLDISLFNKKGIMSYHKTKGKSNIRKHKKLYCIFIICITQCWKFYFVVMSGKGKIHNKKFVWVNNTQLF